MGSLFTGLFGKKQTQQPASALRITTSLQGVPLPWLLGGQQRLPGNLIWYGDFFYESESASGGGKGGLFSGSGGSGYQYYASFVLAACEGPDIEAIVNIWNNGAAGANGVPDGWALFLGTYSQDAWPPPAQSLSYRGLCYSAYGSYQLGSSPSLPQFNIECRSTNSNVMAGAPDGDPSVCWTKFFTDPFRGLGFPSYRMGNLAAWQQYCFATGMLVSPALVSAAVASSFAKNLLEATNSNARWSAGYLSVVPYGDAAITAGELETVRETHLVPSNNWGIDSSGDYAYSAVPVEFGTEFVSDGGVIYTNTGAPFTYTPSLPTASGQYTIIPSIAGFGSNVYVFFALGGGDVGAEVTIAYTYAAAASYQPDNTPVYALTLDNFLANQGTIGQGLAINNSPLIVVRKPRDQMLNVVKLTYLDRDNSYNPVTIEVKNEASLQAFGRWRADTAKEYDFFCLAAAAQQSAALQLQRQQIARSFQWTSGKELILLDVMDIVTVSDPAQGIVNQAVRITEIQENEDFSLTFTAEEFLGTATAPLYNIQAISGFSPAFNEAPGNAAQPILFEPTDELAGGLFVWAAVCGLVPSTWGGCNVWVSLDGTNYKQVTTIKGVARMGLTTGDFPTVAVNPTGQTIDQTNTLAVNLTESEGELTSGTVLDATSLSTACYVGPATGGGEVVAYETATLTSAYNYGLTYLVRGAYGTEAEIVDHPLGSSLARLDSQIAQIPFNQSQIGSTIYIKFQGFNQYQGGTQTLDECAAYSYVIQGTALASPLPDVTNLRAVFNNQTGFTDLYWDNVSDFRSGVVYEIRSGSSWDAASTLGTVASAPFTVPGNGEYWIAAYCQPVSGLNVYSETPQSITIAGAVITQNVILTIDLAAGGWPGTFSGAVGLDTTLNALRTSGSGNVLTDASVLTTPDVLNYGGESTAGGTYYPSGAEINVGYIANISISINFQPTGVPVGQNILTIGNILTTPDILGSASTQYVTGYPVIQTATTETLGVPNWGSWQKFAPGTYQAQWVQFGFYLQTIDPNTEGYNLEFAITATIPARIDSYAVTTSASASSTITFQPASASGPQPFNGGAGPGDLPTVTWGIVDAQAGDDLLITTLSLSEIIFSVQNSGSNVVRQLSMQIEGF